ncbi:DivIVA domain-containing protein [Arthrobacter stackebrandtii]|uniref:Cell wall synthesis protein Wag31 n=1 Tax=Arthrobacter stackebrandtii TaxID=272161 RepID=A0ABS4Z1R5_9MICC|nr:DivIVA domain-containing protein [Arthrobacter stackebrandtii]MBP2414970.1 DivIVA domain-containing protein [Arthrobacter stackebrandtii]PYH00870.1 cell division protein [Arthrobacter stackebrandtii]
MALTPEDVVNKRFQPTKFREGYDQDEVDDFLDEIVVELRRLHQENDDLRKQLAQAEASTGTVPAQAAALPVKEAPVVEKTVVPEPEAPKPVVPEPVVAAPVAAPAPAPAAADSAESATGVIALAQRLHDEYVNSGVEQRDKIIAEAQIEASALVNDAQEKSRKTLGALEQQRSVLERKVEQLRGFERDYRTRLKTYIEGQLRDLDARGSVAAPDFSESSSDS